VQRPVASVSWSPVMICAFPLYVCLQAQVHRPAVNESHAAAPSPADFPLYVCLQAQVHRPAVDGSHAAAPSPADFPLYVCLQAQVHRPAVDESHAAAPSPADFLCSLQAQVHRPAVDGSHAAAPSPADFHCTRACRRRCTVQLSMEVTQQPHPQLIFFVRVLAGAGAPPSCRWKSRSSTIPS